MQVCRHVLIFSALWFGTSAASSSAQRVPHNQDKPPGPALSPEEAIAKMTVPPGFKVEIVAAEPQIVNPVAMTFDERGRVWVTESLEYPRAEPGPGQDRVKILEDTDGDGRMDKVTVFAEGLNIPSGIAVGYGGVWVANAPDILFMQDTDGDGKADKQEVVVTGFGRTDTHELPNSLTWGPDGWLYGLNGVFNFSHVYYAKTNANHKADHPGWKFTCAMFRIHPRTREFQVFAEGTSNPWGIAFDTEGSAFVSACVIDHLWHIVEAGYYHRQGGPYPPFTWKIESIVKHKHQKAAYCGIHYFDSDAYPEQYREKLYMGNIHGNCINVDKLQRDGSTYFATGEPDFLSANDAWFMPVSQKTGPDGCLYILDWYDQYHCYQDARRDPAGIERAKGRLYRVRYTGDAKVASGERRNVSATSAAAMRLYPEFDLKTESDDQLIERLGSANVYNRDMAQRLLAERNTPEIVKRLLAVVLDQKRSLKQRHHAMYALLGCDLTAHKQDWDIPRKLIDSDEAWVRAWALRCASVHEFRAVSGPGGSELLEMGIAELILSGLEDDSPDVRLQALSLIAKLANANRTYVSYDDKIAAALLKSGADPLMMRIAWQALRPYQNLQPTGAIAFLSHEGILKSPAGRELGPRIIEFALTNSRVSGEMLRDMLAIVLKSPETPDVGSGVLRLMAAKFQSGEISGARLETLRTHLSAAIAPLLTSDSEHPLSLDAALVAVTWKDAGALEVARAAFRNSKIPAVRRILALRALISARDETVLSTIQNVLNAGASKPNPVGSGMTYAEFEGEIVSSLGQLRDDEVATFLLERYSRLRPEVKPKAIEVLTQRASWAIKLLAAVTRKEIPPEALNLNHLRKLNATKDPEIIKAVQAQWGIIREGRNPERELVIADMRRLIRANPGDAHRGAEVFKKVCGQCHKIYGEGQEVGPDITLNGRSSFEQLLSNVFDPSLVIGASYQARTILTKQGRVVSGLVAEESDQRVVLKVQGGKQEVIPRSDIEEMKTSEVSLMPEDVEKTLKPQEIADLFAYITLDKPPTDPTAKRLPGVYDETTPARKK
jgi:putative membrane-bound dehydrogenase-like protein